MRSVLLRCLLVNLLALAASYALVLWYPEGDGFTITTPEATHYLGGGEFLGVLLASFFDIGMGVYLMYRLWRPS